MHHARPVLYQFLIMLNVTRTVVVLSKVTRKVAGRKPNGWIGRPLFNTLNVRLRVVG
jgi:hypothetical protein